MHSYIAAPMIRRLTLPIESSPSLADPPVTEGSFAEFTADPVACMRRLHATHGELAIMRDGTQHVVFVFGPRLNHAVLSDPQSYHARFFGIRGPRNSAQRRLTAGLLSMNEEQHKRQRRLLLSSFSRKAIDGYHARLVEATESMLLEWRAGETRDIHRDMTGLMLRITSTILFGFDQATLACEIGRMIERWVSLNHEIGIGALVPDDNFSHRYEELLALADELETALQKMIDLRRRDSAAGHDMLSILLRAHDDQGGLTDEELIGQACVLFGAAHLTSANTLSWTLLLLAQHPQVAAALIEELNATLDGRPPALSDIDRLPQLDRVIKESMRVLPASSYSQRITMCPVELGPLRLPPRTPIVFSQFITHHMAELFENPDAFRPQRWIDLEPSPYAYFPFGAGPRLCLGSSLATMTFKVALPMILMRYRISCVPDSEINGLVQSTMLSPTTPLWLKIEQHDGTVESHPIRGNIHAMVKLAAPAKCQITRTRTVPILP